MKRILSALLALAVLAALAVVTKISKHGVPVVYAATGCSDATLTGNYAINLSGFTSQGPTTGSAIPVTVVGVFAFDGAGNLSAGYSESTNGAIATGQTGSGTYTVNSDCSGSLTFTAGNAVGFTANTVIIGAGKEVFGISTNAGNTDTFDAKHQ
jgi:hypothetical protein